MSSRHAKGELLIFMPKFALPVPFPSQQKAAPPFQLLRPKSLVSSSPYFLCTMHLNHQQVLFSLPSKYFQKSNSFSPLTTMAQVKDRSRYSNDGHKDTHTHTHNPFSFSSLWDCYFSSSPYIFPGLCPQKRGNYFPNNFFMAQNWVSFGYTILIWV